MPVEALVDFTGGFPESYVGPDYGALQGVATDLFKEMQRALEERPGVLITTCSLIKMNCPFSSLRPLPENKQSTKKKNCILYFDFRI